FRRRSRGWDAAAFRLGIDLCVPAELTAYVPLGLRARRLSCCLAFMPCAAFLATPADYFRVFANNQARSPSRDGAAPFDHGIEARRRPSHAQEKPLATIGHDASHLSFHIISFRALAQAR